MPRFDLDAQRALVCVFGILCLLGEAIGYYALGKVLPDIFTGAFVTMAVGPLATSTVERYRQTKRDDPPSPPPPPPSPLSAAEQAEDEEEVFRRDHGYYQLRMA